MSAGDMAAIMAVFELPPRFSRSSQVSTESRYGMKSAFLDFLLFDAYEFERNILEQSELLNMMCQVYFEIATEQFYFSVTSLKLVGF